MTAEQIGAEFARSDDLKLQIVRSIGHHTVAMFAVRDTPTGEALELAGTGTLVAIGETRYILTAAHVWEEKLRRAARVAITVTEKITHRFVIETATICIHRLPKPTGWDEWGPDIALLRIPPEHLGTINAFLGFADRVNHAGISRIDHVQVFVLMGAPYEFAVFRGTSHASVQVNGFFAGEVDERVKGDFDYLDITADLRNTGIPRSFGGVSGGGLWRTCLYWSADKKIDWVCHLVGVAFYESMITPDSAIIRCHGTGTIGQVISMASRGRSRQFSTFSSAC